MNTDILIVGAGFAGASTAYHLSQSFSGSILIIDKEDIAGFHASGRNAALVLQSTPNPDIRRLIVASRKAYSRHRKEIGFEQRGSYLLGTAEELAKVRDSRLVDSEHREPKRVIEQVPLLKGHAFETALWTASDGVMDISALLRFYLDGARSRDVQLWLKCELQGITGRGPYRVETSQGTIEAGCIVNGAGAWAAEIARMAEASELPVVPLKRHLFILDEVPHLDESWPFVWDLHQNFYFRPESGGLLFSICDEEKTHGLEPTVSPDISQALAELVWMELPALREALQRDVWSCFRTKTPDGSLLIGWDHAAKDFFWVAALGGNGMGGSWEIGRLAARLILDPAAKEQNPFDPARFAHLKV